MHAILLCMRASLFFADDKSHGSSQMEQQHARKSLSPLTPVTSAYAMRLYTELSRFAWSFTL